MNTDKKDKITLGVLCVRRDAIPSVAKKFKH